MYDEIVEKEKHVKLNENGVQNLETNRHPGFPRKQTVTQLQFRTTLKTHGNKVLILELKQSRRPILNIGGN